MKSRVHRQAQTPRALADDLRAISGGASSTSDIGPDYIEETKVGDSGHGQRSRAEAGKSIIGEDGQVTLIEPRHVTTDF